MKIRVEGENVTVNSLQDPQVRVKTPHIRDQTDYFAESASRLAMSRASIKSTKLSNTLKSGGYLLSDFASENMEGVDEAIFVDYVVHNTSFGSSDDTFYPGTDKLRSYDYDDDYEGSGYSLDELEDMDADELADLGFDPDDF